MFKGLQAKRSLLPVVLSLVVVAPLLAVTSASFVFDFISDPGDVADGPDYDVTGIGPIDDGSGCDAVVMLMVDATGTPTDVDTFCLSLIDGTGGSDGDYGSFGTGYVPVLSPVTYTLYDINAADIAALTGFGDSDQEYFDYVAANGDCLDEDTVDETDLGIPAGEPFLPCFGQGPSVLEIPTLDSAGLAISGLLLAAASLVLLRRRVQ